MEITKALCESILETLPIGYYAGRRISITLDDKAESSFYSPMEDTIVVSFPIIAERMSKASEDVNPENAVRSMLYHEVSHAILTPKHMPARDYMNIMEDERIETVLRNYYHGVDFKKQLYDLCGGPSKATNPLQAFFNAVRFGFAPQEILDEVNKILRRYKGVHRNCDDYYPYQYDTSHLYEKISRMFKSNPSAFQPPKSDSTGEQKQMDSLKNGSSQNGSSNKEGQQGGSPSDGNSTSEGQKKEESNGRGSNTETKEGNGGNGEYNEPTSIGDDERGVILSKDELKKMFEEAFDDHQELPEEHRKQLEDFRKTAETIIGNFNKKNKSGSGVNAYSGVFNPRAVVRQDYRFFERSMSTQGNNKFGTCHLNLIIDCSGSFSGNATLTNAIIAVLTEIERKNRNFSMDVAFINHELHVCKSVRDRRLQAWGGNKIPENMKEVLMSLQKPKTCNYNIILFDGDAMCNNHDCHCMSAYRQRFGVFDMKQTTLITDPENDQYINDSFTSTKVVITKKYTEELVRHITRALTIAFG